MFCLFFIIIIYFFMALYCLYGLFPAIKDHCSNCNFRLQVLSISHIILKKDTEQSIQPIIKISFCMYEQIAQIDLDI